MTFQFDAIFDNGVIKPIEPLALPNQSRIKVTVEAAESENAAAILAEQQAALAEARRVVKSMQQHRNNDGWSVRDHDKLLYDELQQ